MKSNSKTRFGDLAIAAVVLAVVIASGLWQRQKASVNADVEKPAVAPKSPASVNAGSSNAPVAAKSSLQQNLPAPFQKHPFAISRENGDYSWTAADGKKADVIRQLAHNELEVERMTEENARIFRRQLVYAKKTADLLEQQARLAGEPLREITLPGFDGQEVQFEIADADLSASGQQGAFSGHIAGKPDSTVTFAFKGGREAFTILSPSDGLYLVGEPREPGQLIVKSIDPKTYVVGVCGNP